jgi:hypothetical protein
MGSNAMYEMLTRAAEYVMIWWDNSDCVQIGERFKHVMPYIHVRIETVARLRQTIVNRYTWLPAQDISLDLAG